MLSDKHRFFRGSERCLEKERVPGFIAQCNFRGSERCLEKERVPGFIAQCNFRKSGWTQLSIILDFEGLKMLSTNSVPEIFRVSRCLTERCLTIDIYCTMEFLDMEKFTSILCLFVCLYCTVQYSTVQYCSTVQYSTYDVQQCYCVPATLSRTRSFPGKQPRC